MKSESFVVSASVLVIVQIASPAASIVEVKSVSKPARAIVTSLLAFPITSQVTPPPPQDCQAKRAPPPVSEVKQNSSVAVP